MIEDFLFKKTEIPMLQNDLGAYTTRQKVIAGNIANVATPGYKRREVEFEAHFNDALTLGGATPLAGATTQPMHMAINELESNQMKIQVVESKETDQLASGVNNVDIDLEMSELAQNQIRFKYASRMIADMFKMMRKSISGGGTSA